MERIEMHQDSFQGEVTKGVSRRRLLTSGLGGGSSLLIAGALLSSCADRQTSNIAAAALILRELSLNPPVELSSLFEDDIELDELIQKLASQIVKSSENSLEEVEALIQGKIAEDWDQARAVWYHNWCISYTEVVLAGIFHISDNE